MNLQHNKTIVVDGPKVKMVVCGSTNFSWRGFYVQANNAMVLDGASAVALFARGVRQLLGDDAGTGSATPIPRSWTDLGLTDIDAQVAFSPHAPSNALLDAIGDDIATNTTSSLFYSLAFLYQTPGRSRTRSRRSRRTTTIFVYGISDKKVGGIDLQMPDGNVAPVFAVGADEERAGAVQSKEPTGGGGNRMHHKFVVIDFDKPTARVYLGLVQLLDRRPTRRTARTCCSFATAASRCPTRSRRCASSTTTISASRSSRPRRPGRSCSSPGRRARPARSPGGTKTTPMPARSAIANCSRSGGPMRPAIDMRPPMTVAAAAAPQRIAAPALVAPDQPAPRSVTEQLSGTWQLVSWKIQQADGELIDSPLGGDPRGSIMYDGRGHMSVALMRPDRPTFASDNLTDATPEEIAAAFAGYVGYCGSYEVNEQQRFVIHRIELSWFPNLVGTQQKRFFALAGDRLTLETPPLTLLGDAQVHRLVWQRLMRRGVPPSTGCRRRLRLTRRRPSRRSAPSACRQTASVCDCWTA